MQSAPLEIEQITHALASRDFSFLRETFLNMDIADIGELLTDFPVEQVVVLFRLVEKERRAELYAYLPFELQEQLLDELPDVVLSSILNNMEAVDRTKLLEDLNYVIRDRIIKMMTPEERVVARQLLRFPEDSVGRLMDPEFLALKPDMKAHEAIEHLRWHGDYAESAMQNLFVVDTGGQFLGDVSLSQIVLHPLQMIGELMTPSQATLSANDDREHAVDYFRKYDRHFAPVVNEDSKVIGVVRSDDIFDVAEEEATEDIQQFGGTEVLGAPYLQLSILELVQKRAGWLIVLFFGEMLTATAMGYYEHQIERAVVLALFIPLIISSGGNSGSQASTLVVRALALKEVDLSDWLKIFSREIVGGFLLGLILAVIGMARIVLWPTRKEAFTEHYFLVGLSVSISLTGVVLWGSLCGSMLPFILKRLKLDPATASAPFVATIVDVMGLIIYFSIATYFLRGTLL